MRRVFFVLAMALVATPLAVGVVAAQDGNISSADGDLPCEEPDQVDRTIQLCSAELEDGEAVIVFESDRNQSVVLSDMADTLRRGEISQRTVELQSNERTSVRWSVSTTEDGRAGISISTQRVLYSVPLKDEQPIIGPPWSAGDTQLAVLVTLIVGSVVTVGVVWRKSGGRDREPVRKA